MLNQNSKFFKIEGKLNTLLMKYVLSTFSKKVIINFYLFPNIKAHS